MSTSAIFSTDSSMLVFTCMACVVTRYEKFFKISKHAVWKTIKKKKKTREHTAQFNTLNSALSTLYRRWIWNRNGAKSHRRCRGTRAPPNVSRPVKPYLRVMFSGLIKKSHPRGFSCENSHFDPPLPPHPEVYLYGIRTRLYRYRLKRRLREKNSIPPENNDKQKKKI